MSDESPAIVEEWQDGDVVQLRFTDSDGQLSTLKASEFAEVLQGLTELKGRLAQAGAFGDEVAPDLRVRPPKSGSFIVEAVLADPFNAATATSTTAGLLIGAIGLGVRKLRGAVPTDIEVLPDDMVKVKWSDSTVNTVPRRVWDDLNKMKRPTKRAFRKLMSPLGDDADALEVRSGDLDKTTGDVDYSSNAVEATRTDYRVAARESDETTEEEETFRDVEAQLLSIDFESRDKWRVRSTLGTRKATIEDESFLRGLDKGLALHKNDIFTVTIQETRTKKNGRTTTEWVLTDVVRKRRGGTDDDDQSSAPAPPSSD